MLRSSRTWLEPSWSTMTSRTANLSAPVARSVPRFSLIAALARATAAAGVGPGSALGAPVAVLAPVNPRAVAVATAVAAASRADLVHPRAPSRVSRGPHAPGTRCRNVTARSPRVARGWEKLPSPRARASFRPCRAVASRHGGVPRQSSWRSRGGRSGSATRTRSTSRSAGSTKLDSCSYFLAVGDGILGALRDRPTTLERWPGGVFEGAKLSTRADNRGDAFYQKRVPQGRSRLWRPRT